MILDKIVAVKKEEIKIAKELRPLKTFVDKIELAEPSFYKALSKSGISLIAEIKKASPSKGIIRADFDPVKIAFEYENANVDAISVLTDKEFFQGDLEYLHMVSKNVKTPLLRKEFIIDEYQIYEAKLKGAHAILLIGEILTYKELSRFIELAKGLKLDVLVEVHSHEILKKVLDTEANIVGVNNRNLQTFEVNINNAIELKNKIDKNRLVVAESGIRDRLDVEILEKAGIDAMLIGETIMRSNDMKGKIDELLGR